jgi:hypothetical protein
MSTNFNQLCQVSDFLSLHIHRIKDENEFVYYPDSNCILVGAYTNNQHVLGKYIYIFRDFFFAWIAISLTCSSSQCGTMQ